MKYQIFFYENYYVTIQLNYIRMNENIKILKY